jgi:hypothetical protein
MVEAAALQQVHEKLAQLHGMAQGRGLIAYDTDTDSQAQHPN